MGTAYNVPMSRTVRVWGIVSFIGIRFATTFKLISEINSTLSFLYNLTILELYGSIADTN